MKKFVVLFAVLIVCASALAACQPARPVPELVATPVVEPTVVVFEEVVPTSTPAPAGTFYVTQTGKYEVKMEAVANTAFGGEASFQVSVVPSDKGGLTLNEATTEFARVTREMNENCPLDKGWSGTENGVSYLTVQSPEFGCYEYVKSHGGTVYNGLPQEALDVLESYQASADRVERGNMNTLVFLSKETGLAIGYTRSSDFLPSIAKPCFADALRTNGWKGEDLLVLNLFYSMSARDDGLPEAYKVFSKYAVNYLTNGAAELPAFCGEGMVAKTTKPDWVKETHQNDSYEYSFGDMKLRFHTNSGICTVYPNAFAEGQTVVEIEYEGSSGFLKYGTLEEGSLIWVSKDNSENEQYTYLGFVEGKPVWYTASQDNPPENLAALNVVGVDGQYFWPYPNYKTPAAYRLAATGEVVYQAKMPEAPRGE